MTENQQIRSVLHTCIGSVGWYPVSDTSEVTRFGKVKEVKNYGSYNVYEVEFEDKSRAFLSDKNLKDKKMKVIIRPAECVSNPLEDMGIICINRNNTKESDISGRLKILSEQGFTFKRVYCYDHSGRVFSETPSNGCQFDNYLYGLFGFPKDFDLSDKSVESVYELYTQWAEGDVYDYIIIKDTEDDLCSSVFDYMLEKIDFQAMYENGSMLIQEFMKNNGISKKSVINEDINYDERFAPLRSLYLGKTKQGLILKSEIEDLEWNYEIFGIENVEKEIEDSKSL